MKNIVMLPLQLPYDEIRKESGLVVSAFIPPYNVRLRTRDGRQDELREEEQSVYDESYGLRFDIYERVHLADELIGIDQLEEVELTPHIQVIPAGEQVTVRGSLLLSGVYLGTGDDRRSQSLEHWIPVEITLPLNRVRSLDDICVDIEHFDVDLLSTRSLNITGVLSLKGIYVEQPEPTAWETEQFTVVHEAQQPAAEVRQEASPSPEPSWLQDYGSHTAQPDSSSGSLAPQQSQFNHEDQVAGISSLESTIESSCQSSAPEWSADEALQQPFSHLQYQAAPGAAYAVEQREEEFPASSSYEWQEEPTTAYEQAETVQREPADFDERVEARAPQAEQHGLQQSSEHSWTWSDSPWATASVSALGEAETGLAAEGTISASESEEREVAQAAHVPSVEAEQPEVDVIDSDSAGENRADTSSAVEQTAEIDTEVSTDKKEMKVAIGSTKPVAAPQQEQGLGFSTLLHSSRQAKDKEREAVIRQAEEEAAQQEASKTVTEDVHWQSIFLNRVHDDSHFSRVRMCIVQRQDTLDSIADRYQLNPRELALYNRLAEPSISEGQVLYIPSVSAATS
ncbi:LysM peptidoglycan-binding domain-containing protein [Paenibacillus sp. UMB4589-SE434]|uniref:LysM peptidoglycan-binding domain-containing protein n=1 Tax=Paenibacillus sp. UMB4589-SE434 TaxID=3046314 RepID=UPI00254A2C0D|nr:LysM peptidoglycan-binding domain-containing protein [Paenibacillus sp. UMB4589-SE434]MDK8183778.1 LysM peptidoglycan-binding domain-containing protein [Paenibacillus sp. UMB4589-SE434]